MVLLAIEVSEERRALAAERIGGIAEVLARKDLSEGELLRRAGSQTRAVVIGGGLLGLEAARGLQVQGCDVTVVHLLDTLMERQLDPCGGSYLRTKMEQLGVRVLLGRSTKATLGNGADRDVPVGYDTDH